MTNIFIIAATIAVAGCDEPTRPAAEKGKAVRIVVVGPGRDDPDWPIISACVPPTLPMDRNVSAEARAPQASSPARQREMLAALIDEPVDVICLMPIDPDAVREEILRLTRSGRSVVTFGRDVRDSERAAYVGPHEADIGERGAEAVLKWLGETRRSVVVVGSISRDSPQSARYYAAKNKLQGGAADILREVDCGAAPWNAADQVRGESAKYPRVACWLFLNDWPLVSDKVWNPLVPATSNVVVCAASPRWFGRLQRREIQALIGYDIQQAVEGALQTAVDVARRSAMGQRGRDIPAEIITLENIAELERRRAAWLKGERAGAEAAEAPTPPAPPRPVNRPFPDPFEAGRP